MAVSNTRAMPDTRPLHDTFAAAAERFPDRPAVDDPDDPRGPIGYAELDVLANRLRNRLAAWGLGREDRVGIFVRKSIDAVATIFGTLKAGGAYVPVDPTGPIARGAYIFADCEVKVVVVERRFADDLAAELARHGHRPQLLVLDWDSAERPLAAALDRCDAAGAAPQVASADSTPDDLAYILYTSGSTGKPKGVMLSHRNAVSYVDWCHETFRPDARDCFSSHAPFHFDLSILDIYVPLSAGARLVLVSDATGKDPLKLAPLIAERRITVWYSTPSILSLLVQFGRLENHDYSALRIVLFAGEVFPLKHLRALVERWPGRRYFNLYGPTETNVCTFLELPAEIPAERTEPFPIGQACSHAETAVLDEQGNAIEPGEEGELCVRGAGVMLGYWNRPEASAAAWLTDPQNRKWYRTGDIVVEQADGNYNFVGRRDRMVKKRGYRVELGEIEAALYRHQAVKEAAVVAVPDKDGNLLVRAHIAVDGAAPSIIEFKQFCLGELPAYMVPDRFVFQDVLPKTSTDKIDYQRLKEAT